MNFFSRFFNKEKDNYKSLCSAIDSENIDKFTKILQENSIQSLYTNNNQISLLRYIVYNNKTQFFKALIDIALEKKELYKLINEYEADNVNEVKRNLFDFMIIETISNIKNGNERDTSEMLLYFYNHYPKFNGETFNIISATINNGVYDKQQNKLPLEKLLFNLLNIYFKNNQGGDVLSRDIKRYMEEKGKTAKQFCMHQIFNLHYLREDIIDLLINNKFTFHKEDHENYSDLYINHKMAITNNENLTNHYKTVKYLIYNYEYNIFSHKQGSYEDLIHNVDLNELKSIFNNLGNYINKEYIKNESLNLSYLHFDAKKTEFLINKGAEYKLDENYPLLKAYLNIKNIDKEQEKKFQEFVCLFQKYDGLNPVIEVEHQGEIQKSNIIDFYGLRDNFISKKMISEILSNEEKNNFENIDIEYCLQAWTEENKKNLRSRMAKIEKNKIEEKIENEESISIKKTRRL